MIEQFGSISRSIKQFNERKRTRQDLTTEEIEY
jgi:hypothetical protein